MAQFTLDGVTYSRFRDIPGAVYTRSGVEYQQDASGVWTSFDDDVPPISAGVGVDVWEARTNSIRNPTGLGVVAGTPGTLPTNWSVPSTSNGLSRQVVGFGTTSSGLPYVDIRYSGTTTAASFIAASFEVGGVATASQGQTWTHSCYMALVGGSLANLTSATLRIAQHGAAASYLAEVTGTPPSLMGLTADLTKMTVSGVANNASVISVSPYWQVYYPNGVAVDFTLRVAAPNLKLGADIGDPPILQTTNAAATRGNPSMYINAPGLLVPPFTVQVWAQLPALDGVARALVQIDDGSNTNRIFLQRSSGNAASMGTAGGSGGVPTAFSGKTGARLLKMAARVRSTELALACDGAAPNSASGVTLPPNLSRVLLGGNASAQFYPNGAIQRFQVINRDVSDAELQALTA